MCCDEDTFLIKHVLRESWDFIGSWAALSAYKDVDEDTGVRLHGDLMDKVHETINKNRLKLVSQEFDEHELQFIKDHIIQPWGELMAHLEDSNKTNVERINKVFNTGILKQKLSLTTVPPTCDCDVICKDEKQYFERHLHNIAQCCDEREIKAYMKNHYVDKNTGKSTIPTALEGEKFARIRRACDPKKRRINRSIYGAPQPTMKSMIRFVNRKQRPSVRKQACFAAMSCPRRGNGCPFYHNPEVEHYNQSVVVTKRHCIMGHRVQPTRLNDRGYYEGARNYDHHRRPSCYNERFESRRYNY